ncbi:bax inhibitor 1-like [Solanum verrucosum]|uniref:bax inhibitor 1-like n=1 Tax=Solanum verrucosum TaxID=315347 RepID=UPI0020D14E24|nr:bax inhibitor 1-like [Solanum verrucosum]
MNGVKSCFERNWNRDLMNDVKSYFGRNWNRDEMMNNVKSYFRRNWNRDDVMSNVKSYFVRNWNRDDMMNMDEILVEVHTSLKKVYLTPFCAMLSSTFGSYVRWISVAGWKFTVLSYVASLILIYYTPPGRVVLLLMLAACLFGASVNAFTNYLFKIEQRLLKVATRICAFLANLYVVTTFACSVTTLLLLYVLRLLAGTTTGCGSFLYRIIRTRKRRKIYLGCMKYCFVIMLSTFGFVVLDSSHTIHWAINMHLAQTLFMGYLVIYSQEILYDANLGDINFVNCTFTVFLHLPGILIHAARLYLQDAEIEQQEQN